jgi:ATP-dependent Clp protease adaptor protein ClpS
MVKKQSLGFNERLERSLHTALSDARLNNREYATIEHLLLALLNNPEAFAVLSACDVDIDGLRSELRTITLADMTNPVIDHREEPVPTSGFQRAIQKAVIRVQGASRYDVTGADVLVSIFDERGSQCVASLNKYGLTYFDAARYLAHGVKVTAATADPTYQDPRVKPPGLYRVVLMNDDFTPMDFVVTVLGEFFQMEQESAKKLMLSIHEAGSGECGVYTYEVAETKITQVMDFARQHQHPLQCVMEKK